MWLSERYVVWVICWKNPDMPNITSLKKEILFRLVVPLMLFVSLDVVLSYFVTLHYVNLTYDRWLLNSADSLAQEIILRQGRVEVELPEPALEIFKWNESEKIYFKVQSEKQGLIAGDKFVPEPLSPKIDWTSPVYFDDQLYGEPVRVVSVLIRLKDSSDNVFVHVAETVHNRRAMMRDILLADLLPQLLLVVCAAWYLKRGLNQGLKPLHELARQIAGRSARDLNPIAEQHVFEEVRTLTDTINQLLQRLSAAIATQQRFVTNAAHQLRTPLAGLKLQAERALREYTVEDMQPALKQIQSSADRMAHLTQQLLILARTEPVQGASELKPVNMPALLQQVCMEWVPKALQKNMTISFDCPDKALRVMGDELLLTELINNLIDNAINYGYEGGQITVSLLAKPEITLGIEDDGPGIPAQEAKKVFERFYRIPGSPNDDGCGLGLAIVHDIAALHYAVLRLTSRPAINGTKFEMTFPR